MQLGGPGGRPRLLRRRRPGWRVPPPAAAAAVRVVGLLLLLGWRLLLLWGQGPVLLLLVGRGALLLLVGSGPGGIGGSHRALPIDAGGVLLEGGLRVKSGGGRCRGRLLLLVLRLRLVLLRLGLVLRLLLLLQPDGSHLLLGALRLLIRLLLKVPDEVVPVWWAKEAKGAKK